MTTVPGEGDIIWAAGARLTDEQIEERLREADPLRVWRTPPGRSAEEIRAMPDSELVWIEDDEDEDYRSDSSGSATNVARPGSPRA